MDINTGMQIKTERPPLARFETRAVERRDAAGKPVYEDVDYALITPVGTKDVHEKIVSEWFPHMAELERMERWNPAWTEHYKEAYKRFRAGQNVPLNGTSLLNWPVISKAQRANAAAFAIFTIEDLAGANEETIGRLGMGGRNLVSLAKDWIAASGSGAATLTAELTSLRIKVTALEEANKTLQTRNEALEAQLAVRGTHEQGPTPSAAGADLASTLRANAADAADSDLDKILG